MANIRRAAVLQARQSMSAQNQAAYALSQADLAAVASLDRRPDPRSGAGWHFQAAGETSRAGHTPGMWRCAAGGAWGNAVGETSRTQTTSPPRCTPVGPGRAGARG